LQTGPELQPARVTIRVALGATAGIAFARRGAGYVGTSVARTRAAGAAVSGAGARVAGAPGVARTRATERSEEIRQRLRDARSTAGRLRNPRAAREADTRAVEADRASRAEWM
jgi:hypothetical protein